MYKKEHTKESLLENIIIMYILQFFVFARKY